MDRLLFFLMCSIMFLRVCRWVRMKWISSCEVVSSVSISISMVMV